VNVENERKIWNSFCDSPIVTSIGNMSRSSIE
jgi:hypothetical protein